MKSLLTQKLTDDRESFPFANFVVSLRAAFMKLVTIRRARIATRSVAGLGVHSPACRAEGLAKADPFVVGFLSAFICGWISFVSCIYELC
jgi:hypothetical protein